MTDLFERYAAVYRLERAAAGLKSSYWSSVNVSRTFFFPTNEMMSPFSMSLLFGLPQEHFDEDSSFFAVADASFLNKYQEMAGVN